MYWPVSVCESFGGRMVFVHASNGVEMSGNPEVVRWLPEGFVNAYETLLAGTYGDGLGQGPGGLGHTPESGIVSGGEGFSSRVPLKAGADACIEVRKSVDRRLRALGRDVAAWAESGDWNKTVRKEKRCYRCEKYGESSWTYCAWCGSVVGGAVVYRCECGPEIHQGTRSDVIYCARRRGDLPDSVPDSMVTVEWMSPSVDMAGRVKV